MVFLPGLSLMVPTSHSTYYLSTEKEGAYGTAFSCERSSMFDED